MSRLSAQREAFLLLILIALVSGAVPLQAYVDPGSGSLLVQMLLGGAAGLIVAVRYYWKRFVANVTTRRSNSTSTDHRQS